MTPSSAPDIICIGAALWDFVGRSSTAMRPGADVSGRITRVPGGVALNVAMMMRRFGLAPTLLTAIGQDPEGDELLAACRLRDVGTEYVFRSADLPTDRYLALEDANGLVGAIADAHTLEAAAGKILSPLEDGRLGSAQRPWKGLVALDGNLTAELLATIASSPLLAGADLRVAPASPGKVERLRPLLVHPRVTLYMNIHEAEALCGKSLSGAPEAAELLLANGAHRVLVTDGGRACAEGTVGSSVISAIPPSVTVNRVTGAGDTLMAAHIVAERKGASRADALAAALAAAAHYVAGDIGS
jgi:sugar/nucleoside kinase (ribokinase family)